MNGVCDEEPMIIPLSSWVPIDGLLNNVYSYHYEANYQQVLNESGILMCNACSLDYNDCKETPAKTTIYLSEFDEGFEVKGPVNDTAIELQTITLMCAASKYLYTSVDWYKQNDDTAVWELFENISEDTKNVHIGKDFSTKFSYVSNITFTQINLQQKGNYECRAVPIIDQEDPSVERVKMKVLKSIKPYKVSSFNMNDTNKCTEKSCTEGMDTLILDCSVKGRPEPTVEWRFKPKDEDSFQNFPPNSSYFEETFEFSPNNQKIIFKSLWKEQSGVYQCIARNVADEIVGERKISIVKHSPITKGLIAGVVIGTLILVSLIIFLSYKLCWYNKQLRKLTDIEMKMFEEGDVSKINPTLGVDDQADLLPYNKEFEFDRRKLTLGDQIGSGAFGRVVKATADGILNKNEKTSVAVKMVKRDADITYIKALMAELKIMIHFGKVSNKNIIQSIIEYLKIKLG